MLDINLDIVTKSPKRFLNDIVRLASEKTDRAVLDRRSAGDGDRAPSKGPRRRRRHDGLHNEKRSPLEW